MRRLVLAAALVAAVAGVLVGSSSAKVIQKCIWNVRPGTEVVNKTTIRVFCGPAKATVRAGSVTYKRSNGACYKAVGSLNVGLGKYQLGRSPMYPGLFLSVASTRDGTYRNGVLTLLSKGKSAVASKVRVVLSGKRSHGTFSGKFLNGPKFTGSFTCK